MLPQLERQFLQANLSQVQALLAECGQEGDPIGHHQYSQLVNEITVKLAGVASDIASSPAAVALFFGGRPVIGSHGIQADFGGKAVSSFQKIVSQRFAAEERGPLANSGRVPLRESTHLLITDVVRGSFGFVLQAATEDACDTGDNSLKSVVDKVASTISRVAAQDEMLFEEAAAEIDERQKISLTEFFRLLDTEGATVRIVEGERDFQLDHASVQRARARVEQLEIDERDEEYSGQIRGWEDYSPRFQLLPYGQAEIMRGGIANETHERIAVEGLEIYHKHVRAQIRIRQVTARNRPPKTSYTLLSLEVIAPPKDWKATTSQTPISD